MISERFYPPLVVFEERHEMVRCRCSGEFTHVDKARRLGCDQRGGCPELRDSTE